MSKVNYRFIKLLLESSISVAEEMIKEPNKEKRSVIANTWTATAQTIDTWLDDFIYLSEEEANVVLDKIKNDINNLDIDEEALHEASEQLELFYNYKGKKVEA